MTPDEQMEIYNRGFEAGKTHSKPSPDTIEWFTGLKQQVNDHIEDHKDLTNRISTVEKTLGEKVSWTVFWSIVVLLTGIVITTFGLLYNAIKEVQNTGVQTKTDVSYIKGVLDKAEITQ